VAVAIAYRAIQNGSDARFVTAAHLLDELSSASRDGQLRQALTEYTHPGVLVIDEVGYLSLGTDAANVLFQVVNDRHLHRRPMVFTTNKPIEEWGRVLHDADLAEAILDRVLERGRVLHFKGPSYRTRHLRSEGARISGKPGPEFQELTTINRISSPTCCVTTLHRLHSHPSARRRRGPSPARAHRSQLQPRKSRGSGPS
jgi:hypothetical protein